MTVWADFEAFLNAHRDHGPIAVIATPPEAIGYDVEAACACGASQSGRVTLVDLGGAPRCGGGLPRAPSRSQARCEGAGV